MRNTEFVEFQWPYLATLIGSSEEIARSAVAAGALIRRREVRSADTLLRLAITYGFCGFSLRQTAAYAQTVGFATISDVALLKRLRRCGPWLGELLAHKLAQRAGGGELPGNQLRLRLIDATTVARPGSTGIDWRLHMSMDVSRGRVDHIELTDAKGAETLTRFAFASSDLVIADRGYAKAKDLDHVSRASAFFIVRTSRHSMKLEHRDGRPFDYVEGLNQLPEAAAGEFAVQVRVSPKHTLPCRLIGIRKSEPAAERTRSKILAESRKKHRITDPRTLESAGFMAVLTNLPVDQAAPEQILDLYRFRWQIEMNFKDLKSVLELDALPAKDPALARTYLYAKLLGTFLIDDLTTRSFFFPLGIQSPTGPSRHGGCIGFCEINSSLPSASPPSAPHGNASCSVIATSSKIRERARINAPSLRLARSP